MRTTPVDYALLGIFVAVADERSFSKAALRLGITKGTVSRAIAKLESLVGFELIHRTTHKVSLSTAGTALYERTAPHLAALQHAVGRLPESAEQPSGELRLTAPHDLGVILLPGLLSAFSLRYPAVRFDVRLSNERFDLVAEGYDVALRASAGKLENSSLAVRRIASIDVRCYAAPAYVARRGEPRAYGEAGHEWIDFSSSPKMAGVAHEAYSPRYRCDDFFLVRDLLREGAGVGPLPTMLAAPYVRAGLLVPILPVAHWKGTGGLFMLYPSSKRVPRKVVAFRDFLLAYLTKRPIDCEVT